MFGDDESVDAASTLLHDWVGDKESIKILQIAQNSQAKNDKAQALNQLITIVSDKVFFFTDRDCRVPSNWIHSSLEILEDTSIDFIIGKVEVLQPHDIIQEFQAFDC